MAWRRYATIVAALRLMTEHMLNHAIVLIIRWMVWIFIDFSKSYINFVVPNRVLHTLGHIVIAPLSILFALRSEWNASHTILRARECDGNYFSM